MYSIYLWCYWAYVRPSYYNFPGSDSASISSLKWRLSRLSSLVMNVGSEHFPNNYRFYVFSLAVLLTLFRGSVGASVGLDQAPRPRKMLLSLLPTVTQTGGESWWITWNLQISIVSAVKIFKQCLQTASASGLHTGASFLDPTGGPDPRGYSPQWKFLAPPLC